jgi:serine/threonine protein kinase
MSPELLFDEEYSNSVDVFSFGMVLLEIMKRQQVGKRRDQSFAARYPQNSFTLDVDAVQEALPIDAPPSLVMLALQCCEYDVADRPFSDDVYDWLLELGESFEESGEERPTMPPIPEELQDESSGATEEVEDRSTEAIGKLSMQSVQGMRSLHSLVEIQSPDTILKAGNMYKRNHTGFKNWKSRFFVLTPYQIRWYVSSKDLTCEKGHIDLINARVGRTKHHR